MIEGVERLVEATAEFLADVLVAKRFRGFDEKLLPRNRALVWYACNERRSYLDVVKIVDIASVYGRHVLFVGYV